MIRALAELRLRNWLQVVNESVIRPVKMLSMEPAGVRLWRLGWSLLCVPTLSTIIEPLLMVYSPDALIFILLEAPCQGATPTSDKARRPTPTTGDRGRRWRLIGKEGPASKVLSGTYENVAEVGTGRVALSMQRLRQGGTTK